MLLLRRLKTAAAAVGEWVVVLRCWLTVTTAGVAIGGLKLVVIILRDHGGVWLD